MNDHQKQFDIARKLYPGSKVGNANEFKNFVTRSLYPAKGKCKFSIKEVLPLLVPAIKRQIRWREEAKVGEFREPWKNFQTWINDNYWEFEPPLITQIPNCAKVCDTCGKEASGQAKGKWHCPEHNPYGRVKFVRPEIHNRSSVEPVKQAERSASTTGDTTDASDKAGGGSLSPSNTRICELCKKGRAKHQVTVNFITMNVCDKCKPTGQSAPYPKTAGDSPPKSPNASKGSVETPASTLGKQEYKERIENAVKGFFKETK